MTGPRDYSAGTRTALVALSQGTCYFPSCITPIIEFIEGEPYVNYQIAHICDAKPGNRYVEDMTDDERRSFDNLVLLCKPHHTLVDKTHPERFSISDLRQWKAEREGDAVESLKGLRGLTEARLEELMTAAVAESGRASVGAEAVVGAARAAARLDAGLRDSRQAVAAEVDLWHRTWQAVRGSFLAWDPDTGERVYAEPSAVETERHRAAVAEGLEMASTAASPFVSDLKKELAAVRAVSPQLRPWCDEVVRALDRVVQCVGRWPEPPPFEDDRAFEESLLVLAESVDALTGKWRGEDIPEPVPPPPAPTPVETAEARRFREHRELLDGARRYARATGLPYDEELALQLLDAASFAARMPPVISLWPWALASTAGLVADVARNADDDSFHDLVSRCLDVPLVVGVFVTRHLASVANEAGCEARVQISIDTTRALLASADWSDTDVWAGVEAYGRDLLAIDAALTSVEQTMSRLDAALESRPGVLPGLIRSCADWLEHHDSRTGRHLGWSRRYTELPAWFPTTKVVDAIRTAFPGLVAAEEPTTDDETEALAAQILYLANGSGRRAK